MLVSQVESTDAEHALATTVDEMKPRGATTNRWAGFSTAGCAWSVYHGDAREVLRTLADESFNCVVTSPPYYWQRNYGVDGQIGQEATIDGYVAAITAVMAEVRRILARDGLLFLNLGDTYYSGKGEPKGKDPKSKSRRFGLRAVDASGLGVAPKTTIGIPWRVALSMISRRWVLRSPIVWHREGCIPEPSAQDRPWRTHEYIFMFAKSRRYYFKREALGEEEDVWSIPARPRPTADIRTAPFPDELVQRCLDTGCPPGGSVLDPFAGSGTTTRVALMSNRPAVGIDLNGDFCQYMVAQLSGI